jgi:ligand-binding sensor domain-containing protein
MIRFFIFPVFFLAMVVPSSCSREQYSVIGQMHIYNIQQHNGSIYFSTVDSGIFRFSSACPDSLHRVGKKYRHPVRSIAFSQDGAWYASSYFSDMHSRDSLLPFILFSQPAWSVKIDVHGNPWLAGLDGIYRHQAGGLSLFNSMSGVHDIAFHDKQLAVAHKDGISIFDQETGALMRVFCKGIICWTITQFDSLLIGGGLNVCVIIDKDNYKSITFGPSKNMLWATALTSDGTLYLATQKGLFRAKKNENKAHCVGFKGICIKSLLVDKNGRLWIGRFAKDIK